MDRSIIDELQQKYSSAIESGNLKSTLKKESTENGIIIIILSSKDKKMTAVEIMKKIKANNIKTTRKEINRILYKVLQSASIVEMIDTGGRPIWRLLSDTNDEDSVNQEDESEVHPNTPVLIDLGNVHDCLIPAARLIEESDPSDLNLKCFANMGINPPGIGDHNKYVVTDTTGQPNAAFVMMLSEAVLILEREETTHLILVSNDKMIKTFAALARQWYPEIEITLITGNKAWPELREYLE